ncbi:MAG: hypothetical protein VX246_05785 [Myxococcota bacterium]|nr:hypothetical protein [Myxococcota bacterium]
MATKQPASSGDSESNSEVDVHELGERVKLMRSRFDELRGRL